MVVVQLLSGTWWSTSNYYPAPDGRRPIIIRHLMVVLQLLSGTWRSSSNYYPAPDGRLPIIIREKDQGEGDAAPHRSPGGHVFHKIGTVNAR